MKFGQLILRTIVKIVATKCQILRLKCTKIDFGSAPDPAGELTALPQAPYLDLRGPTSNGREGKREGRQGKKAAGGEEGEGRVREGRKEGRGPPCVSLNFP